jgi:AcrR family transcriptional regulator
MRKIADKAGVPIGSVYQYFPDKNALLSALSLGYYARMNARLEEALARIERMEQVPAFADAMIDVLLLELGAARSHLNVWAASQSDEVLRKLDMKAALHQAALVTARFQELAPVVDPGTIRDICTFAVVMAGPVIRQSFVMPKPEAARLIREFNDCHRVPSLVMNGRRFRDAPVTLRRFNLRLREPSGSNRALQPRTTKTSPRGTPMAASIFRRRHGLAGVPCRASALLDIANG